MKYARITACLANDRLVKQRKGVGEVKHALFTACLAAVVAILAARAADMPLAKARR